MGKKDELEDLEDWAEKALSLSRGEGTAPTAGRNPNEGIDPDLEIMEALGFGTQTEVSQTKLIQQVTGNVSLPGWGNEKGKLAGEVKPGDVLRWNQGWTGTVIGLGKAGSQIVLKMIDNSTGAERELKKKADTMVGFPPGLNAKGTPDDRIHLAKAWAKKAAASGFQSHEISSANHWVDGPPTEAEVDQMLAKAQAKKDKDAAWAASVKAKDKSSSFSQDVASGAFKVGGGGYGPPPGAMPLTPTSRAVDPGAAQKKAEAQELADLLEDFGNSMDHAFKSMTAAGSLLPLIEKKAQALEIDSGPFMSKLGLIVKPFETFLSGLGSMKAAAVFLRGHAAKMATESRRAAPRDATSLFAEMRELAGLSQDDLSSFVEARDRSLPRR